VSISIDALSAVRRAAQVEYEQLLQRQTLDCGIAFYSREYQPLGQANQVREVVLAGKRTMQQAFEEVESFYGGMGLACRRWVPASTQSPEPLEAFLEPRGFTAVRKLTMLLRDEPQPEARSDIRIVPARAMRRALSELVAGEAAEGEREARVAMSLNRLDDPQYDSFLAMHEGRAAGHGALFQVGDIARIEGFFVREPLRGQGIGTALMAHLIALTRRLAMRITCTELPADDERTRALYERCGFERGQTYVEFHASGPP
jgi:GNAT superfamily N-acetyltransferase